MFMPWPSGALRAGIVLNRRWEAGCIAQLVGGFGTNPGFELKATNYLFFFAYHLPRWR